MRLVLRPVGAYLSRFYTDEKKKKKKSRTLISDMNACDEMMGE